MERSVAMGDFFEWGAKAFQRPFLDLIQELQRQVNVFPPDPADVAGYRGVSRGAEQCCLNLGRREDGDEYSQWTVQLEFRSFLWMRPAMRPAAARLAIRAAVAPAPTPLSTLTTERPGEQVWSMPRIAAVPSPPRP